MKRVTKWTRPDEIIYIPVNGFREPIKGLAWLERQAERFHAYEIPAQIKQNKKQHQRKP